MLSAKHNTSVPRSLQIQCRVVAALLMREIITRYGRHNIGFLWIFFEPMSFTLGVTTLWNVAKFNHGSHLSITTFAVTGYSTILLWRNTANRCALAILPNHSLLHHRNVRVIDLFISRALLEVSGATMSFLFLSMLFIAVGLMEPPKDIALIIVGWLYLAIIAIGLGFIIGSLSELSETYDRMWHTIAYLLFPLSGAAFMVEWLPTTAQKVVLWLPMVHACEMIRYGYFGALVKPHYNVEYMVVADLLMLFIGLVMVRYVSTRVEPES
ncbi:ABC transporter permease [Burkholderia plantarii]|uniref:ABC transporter permease n=1 Tax=Burkholderia plantarii TaxID=41899 RepID=UPI0018DE5677|nr:ABC transporter permease [Burkholderia plantarii]MBI0326207.1 ABC transporter permease [Burkholderia plantarii]